MVKESDYILTDQEVLGGLKAAVARGEELKDAMMTFYQAGYSKTEIEEAAKAYIEMLNPTNVQQSRKLEEEKKKDRKENMKKENSNLDNKKISPIHYQESGTTSINQLKGAEQKVSKYEAPRNSQKNPSEGKAVTMFLILMLLLLLGILVSVILFREELVGFFNSLFA